MKWGKIQYFGTPEPNLIQEQIVSSLRPLQMLIARCTATQSFLLLYFPYNLGYRTVTNMEDQNEVQMLLFHLEHNTADQTEQVVNAREQDEKCNDW